MIIVCQKPLKMLKISGITLFPFIFIRNPEDKKNKMLALNNVRNKIVKTMFACIKNKTKYKADYTFSFTA